MDQPMILPQIQKNPLLMIGFKDGGGISPWQQYPRPLPIISCKSETGQHDCFMNNSLSSSSNSHMLKNKSLNSLVKRILPSTTSEQTSLLDNSATWPGKEYICFVHPPPIVHRYSKSDHGLPRLATENQVKNKEESMCKKCYEKNKRRLLMDEEKRNENNRKHLPKITCIWCQQQQRSSSAIFGEIPRQPLLLLPSMRNANPLNMQKHLDRKIRVRTAPETTTVSNEAYTRLNLQGAGLNKQPTPLTDNNKLDPSNLKELQTSKHHIINPKLLRSKLVSLSKATCTRIHSPIGGIFNVTNSNRGRDAGDESFPMKYADVFPFSERTGYEEERKVNTWPYPSSNQILDGIQSREISFDRMFGPPSSPNLPSTPPHLFSIHKMEHDYSPHMEGLFKYLNFISGDGDEEKDLVREILLILKTFMNLEAYLTDKEMRQIMEVFVKRSEAHHTDIFNDVASTPGSKLNQAKIKATTAFRQMIQELLEEVDDESGTSNTAASQKSISWLINSLKTKIPIVGKVFDYVRNAGDNVLLNQLGFTNNAIKCLNLCLGESGEDDALRFPNGSESHSQVIDKFSAYSYGKDGDEYRQFNDNLHPIDDNAIKMNGSESRNYNYGVINYEKYSDHGELSHDGGDKLNEKKQRGLGMKNELLLILRKQNMKLDDISKTKDKFDGYKTNKMQDPTGVVNSHVAFDGLDYSEGGANEKMNDVTATKLGNIDNSHVSPRQLNNEHVMEQYAENTKANQMGTDEVNNEKQRAHKEEIQSEVEETICSIPLFDAVLIDDERFETMQKEIIEEQQAFVVDKLLSESTTIAIVPELSESANQNRKRLEEYLSKMRPNKFDLNKLKRLAAETRVRRETEIREQQASADRPRDEQAVEFKQTKSKRELIEEQLRSRKQAFSYARKQSQFLNESNTTKMLLDDIPKDVDPETLTGSKRVEAYFRKNPKFFENIVFSLISGSSSNSTSNVGLMDKIDRRATQVTNIDYMSHFKLVDPEKLKMYARAFAVADKDQDKIITSDELKQAILSVATLDDLSDQYLSYITEVLQLHSISKCSFRMFAVICALLEKMKMSSPMTHDIIEGLDLMEVERKITFFRDMFYSSGEDSSSSNFINADQLRLELAAGGLSKEQEESVLQHIQVDDTGGVSFLDYMAYIPLFISIHNKIVENALDNSRDRYRSSSNVSEPLPPPTAAV